MDAAAKTRENDFVYLRSKNGDTSIRVERKVALQIGYLRESLQAYPERNMALDGHCTPEEEDIIIEQVEEAVLEKVIQYCAAHHPDNAPADGADLVQWDTEFVQESNQILVQMFAVS